MSFFFVLCIWLFLIQNFSKCNHYDHTLVLQKFYKYLQSGKPCWKLRAFQLLEGWLFLYPLKSCLWLSRYAFKSVIGWTIRYNFCCSSLYLCSMISWALMVFLSSHLRLTGESSGSSLEQRLCFPHVSVSGIIIEVKSMHKHLSVAFVLFPYS